MHKNTCAHLWHCRHGFFVRCNQPRLAPPMLGLHCTHLLWRSSAQLDNGPLRSCRKNGGKAAVQQSPSRRARRTPSLRMMKETISRETKGQRRTTKPRSSPSHHHDSVTARQHPLICTGTEPIHPVHGPPKLLVTEVISRNEVTFVSDHVCKEKSSCVCYTDQDDKLQDMLALKKRKNVEIGLDQITGWFGLSS